MGKTREIKKRIKAVGNIRRITKTMQMIATSKFARAQQRATATKPYTEGVFELVRKIASVSSADHPLLGGNASDTSRANAKPLTLIITSDRGLCGPYNGSILRTATAFLRETPEAKAGLIEIVGKKGFSFLRFAGIETSEQHQIGDKPTYEQIERLAQSYMDRFIRGEVSVVKVVYMRYFSAGRQKPEVMQLLPLKAPAKAEAKTGGDGAKAEPSANVEYEFSPPAPQLLGSLLPAAVKATLFQVFNDAIVSEHVARMVAMKAATDNAGKMGKRLTRQYNRARQAQITTELTEIISGAAALE